MARRWELAGLVGLLTLSVSLVFPGCGDDEETTGGGGSGATGGGATGGSGGSGAASGDSITFYVGESRYFDATFPPIEGATVAFDAPGGERVELPTGADGKVTFDGIDWSLGSAAATVHRDGYSMFSLVGLDAAKVAAAITVDGGVLLWLVDITPDPVDTVTISGTATGLQDTAHKLDVNVVGLDTGDEWYGNGTATFSVEVPSGVPFTLQAFELTQQPLPSGQGYDMPIYQVMQQSFDATSDDVSGVVLDFSASAMTTHTADVTWTTPSRADSPVRSGFGVGLVCPLGSAYCTGWSTHIDISTDGNQFDDSLLWVEPTWATEPFFLARVLDGSDVISYRIVSGWPQDGVAGTLPDTPEWVTPAAGGQQPLSEPLEWQLFDADVPDVSVRLIKGQTLAWVIEAGANATSVTVPAPPSEVDASAALGLAPRAFVLAGWPNSDASAWEAYGVSKSVILTP